MDSTIPMIVAKLHEDGGDLLDKACPRPWPGLARPPCWTPSPRRYPGPDTTSGSTPSGRWNTSIPTWPWRNASTCWARAERQPSSAPREALYLSHFASEGIKVGARRFLVDRPLDFQSRELRDELVETATIMDERFPEYDEWQAAPSRAGRTSETW